MCVSYAGLGPAVGLCGSSEVHGQILASFEDGAHRGSGKSGIPPGSQNPGILLPQKTASQASPVSLCGTT